MADGEGEEGEGEEGEKRLVDLRRSSLMASPQVITYDLEDFLTMTSLFLRF